MIEDVQRNGFRESGIETVFSKDREVEGHGGGMKMQPDSGGIICYNNKMA
jgi:hypothetical protein